MSIPSHPPQKKYLSAAIFFLLGFFVFLSNRTSTLCFYLCTTFDTQLLALKIMLTLPFINNGNKSNTGSSHLPGRLTALIVSILVALASGTPYLYGVYSPQFVKQVGLTTSDSATISLATNLGSGVGGLPGGLIIDHFGPQKSILLGSVCIFIGYFTMHKIYEAKYDNLLIICLAMVLAGFGSITSYFATLKASQSNFPKHRGAAGAFPVSAYGFAATIFSIISATYFKGNSGGLLEFLSIFCGSMTFLGSFFIHIYLDHHDDREMDPEMSSPEFVSSPSPNYYNIESASSRSPRIEEEISLLSEGNSVIEPPATTMSRQDSLQGSISFWGIGQRTPRESISLQESEANNIVESLRNENVPKQQQEEQLKDPNKLWLNLISVPEFLQKENGRIFAIHYYIVSLASGIGQMYIYSVGFIVTAQYYYGKNKIENLTTENHRFSRNDIHHDPNVDDTVQTLQALQVSVISIASFLGRLFSGFLSDYIYKKWHIQRLWIVPVTLVFLALGQYLTIQNVNDLHLVTLASALIGGSYGLIFGTYPAVIADRFGTRLFSTSWGLVCTGPLITLWILNKSFGKLYDANSDSDTGICYLGNGCYQGAFELSLVLCGMTFVVTLLLIYIQRKQ